MTMTELVDQELAAVLETVAVLVVEAEPAMVVVMVLAAEVVADPK